MATSRCVRVCGFYGVWHYLARWCAATAAKGAARQAIYGAGIVAQPTLGMQPVAPPGPAVPLGPYGMAPVAPPGPAVPSGPNGIAPVAPSCPAAPSGPLGMATVAPPGPTFPTLAHGVPSALTHGGGSAEASGVAAIAAATTPANSSGVKFVSFAIMYEGYHDRRWSNLTSRACGAGSAPRARRGSSR